LKRKNEKNRPIPVPDKALNNPENPRAMREKGGEGFEHR
jgi:hypothetical protein